MARTEGDTWDLASSVGATATAVAASRATASQGPDALLDDPCAEPLVRAVGMDTFVKLRRRRARSATTIPLLNRRAMNEQMAVRTRFFDDFFTAASRFRHPAGGDPGLRARHQGLPAAVARGHRGVRDRPARGHRVQDHARWPISAPSRPPTRRTVADRPARRLAAGADGRRVSTRSQPTAWSAEGLLVYLPPEAQDRLFDNITALSRAGQPDRDRAHGHARASRRLGREADRAVPAHRLRHQPGRAVLHRRAQQRGRLPDRRTAGRWTCGPPQRPTPPTDSSCPTTNWRRSAAIPDTSPRR